VITPVNALGEFGIIKDIFPHELPLNAWSDGRNVSFVDGYAQKTPGYLDVFTTLPHVPYWALPVPKTVTYNWIVAGTAKVYVFDGGDYVNITRQTASVDVDYTGNVDNKWTGCVLGGIPVINNGVDVPQMWIPANTGTKLAALANWPSDTRVKVLRGYKQFLLGLNVTKSSINYPNTLKWSHPADPLDVPVSWDETDPSRDAGEYTFSETGDFLVDCVPLRDANIVYKENTTWLQQFIGGNDIFRFSRLFGTFGALSSECAVEFINGQHLVLARGDLIIHDGQTFQSVLSSRWRRWLRSNLNPDAVSRCFVQVYVAREEVWIGLCTGANTFVDTILVWNWREKTFGIREAPLVSFIAAGLVSETSTSDSWNSDNTTWDTDNTSWGTRLYGPDTPSLLMVAPTRTKLAKIDAATNANGTPLQVRLERTGLGFPRKVEAPPDFTSMKFFRGIYPRIEGTPNGVVEVSLGTQQKIGGEVKWSRTKPYTIGVTKKLDFRGTGRLFGLRFESSSSISWRIHGYDVDVVFAGEF